MKLIKSLLLISLLVNVFPIYAAVKVVECEDKQGNRSFHKACPPGYTLVSEKEIHTGQTPKQLSSNENIHATIYIIPDCEACIEVKEYLNDRNISFEEKDVNENAQIQTELTELVGDLKVPTIVIGESILSGYSRKKLQEALEAVGYIEEEN